MDSNPLLQRAPLGRCLGKWWWLIYARISPCILFIDKNDVVNTHQKPRHIKERGHTLPPGGVTYGMANYKNDSGTGELTH